jgi:two-component system OmpR family response regulator
MNAILPIMDLATRILIVDDDPGIRDAMSEFLTQHGFVVETAADPAAMRARLSRAAYDLIVLDVMMPGEDGLTALRGLAAGDSPPVIMLSAVGADIDRIVGLEMGADDYLVKPCNPRELLARIRTVLRRGARAGTASAGETPRPRADMRLRFDGWTLDPMARTLLDPDGVLIHLSDGEFRLLLALAEHPRRILSRDQLLDYSRGGDSESYDRAVDVQMSRLRRKLGAGAGDSELIRTVRGEGYLFTPAVARA